MMRGCQVLILSVAVLILISCTTSNYEDNTISIDTQDQTKNVDNSKDKNSQNVIIDENSKKDIMGTNSDGKTINTGETTKDSETTVIDTSVSIISDPDGNKEGIAPSDTTNSIICKRTKEVKVNLTKGKISPEPPRWIFVKALPGSTDTADIYGQLDFRGWHSRFKNKKSNGLLILLRNEHSSLQETKPIVFAGGNLTLTIDKENFTIYLPPKTVCWRCNVWYMAYEDGSVEEWNQAEGYLREWVDSRITACPHDEFYTNFEIKRLSVTNGTDFDSKDPEHNNYRLTFNDSDGLKQIDIKSSSGRNIFSKSVNCLTEVPSGSLRIPISDFPLEGSILDCKTGKREFMIKYPFLPDNDCIDLDGDNVEYAGFATKGRVILRDQCANPQQQFDINEAVCLNNDIESISHYCPPGKACDIDGSGNARCRSSKLAELIVAKFNIEGKPRSNNIYPTIVVQNNGNLTAKYFTIHMKTSRAEYKKEVNEVPAGKSFEWGFEMPKLKKDEVLVATVDFTDVIEEGNETDNIKLYEFKLDNFK